jgi:hypothetical protein
MDAKLSKASITLSEYQISCRLSIPFTLHRNLAILPIHSDLLLSAIILSRRKHHEATKPRSTNKLPTCALPFCPYCAISVVDYRQRDSVVFCMATSPRQSVLTVDIHLSTYLDTIFLPVES